MDSICQMLILLLSLFSYPSLFFSVFPHQPSQESGQRPLPGENGQVHGGAEGARHPARRLPDRALPETEARADQPGASARHQGGNTVSRSKIKIIDDLLDHYAFFLGCSFAPPMVGLSHTVWLCLQCIGCEITTVLVNIMEMFTYHSLTAGEMSFIKNVV